VLQSHPPRELPGYFYLGAFTVTDALAMSDPCYAAQTMSLMRRSEPAKGGTWHAYLRPAPDNEARTVALMAAHADHLDALESLGKQIGAFVVDAGQGGIYDLAAAQDPAYTSALRQYVERGGGECLFLGRGAIAHTHFGDGVYMARGVRVKKRLVMARLNLSGERMFDHFHSSAETKQLPIERAERKSLSGLINETPPSALLAYQPERLYTPGQLLQHASFGAGKVLQIVAANKISVRFVDGTVRVLRQGQAPHAEGA
jgi:hypothetical protein